MPDNLVLFSIVAFTALLVAELLYFKLAVRFNIIDKPNERSSHTSLTIRGGGIVFVLAGLGYFAYSGFQHPLFWSGFALISAISFLDDVLTLSSKVRMPVQLFSVILMIAEVETGFVLIPFMIALILITGVINAYNFMDGINGMTAGYSLVALISLLVINQQLEYLENELIVVLISADLVFAMFNFRKKARCFAGDIGSVGMAFIVTFLVYRLIRFTGNPLYIMLFAVYGVDSVLTILYRLRRKENIFEAHRSHVYQWLVKPGSFSHLQVSSIYMSLQVLISLGVILLKDESNAIQAMYACAVLLCLSLGYLMIKINYKKRFELV